MYCVTALRCPSYFLGQNRRNIMSPFLHPLIREKWCVLAFARLDPCFFGRRGFASPFHSVQDCSLQALHAIYASKQVKSWITERQLNVRGLKTATGGKQPFGYYKHDRGVGLGLPRKDSNPEIAGLSLRPVFFTLNVWNCCYFCLLQLPPTLSPNPQRRIVEQFKRALFSPQNSYFVNLKSEVKKVSLFFFTSKSFAKLGRQKGCFTDNWVSGNYFSIRGF